MTTDFTHIGLFEGGGGFSIAAEMIGWTTIAWCEINPFCQTILKYYYPKATPHGDIRQTDFTIYKGKCNILTGGFPCQPYSNAGKRLGKDDDRHLWPEMLRAIREIQPGYVVGENVRGLTNWNGGLVFDEVQADLEAEGYEVLPFLLPACAVNAPHRRDRIWFIAYSVSNGHQLRITGSDRRQAKQSSTEQKKREWVWSNTGRVSRKGDATDTPVQRWDAQSFKNFSGRTGSGQAGICNSEHLSTYTNGIGLRGENNGAGKPEFTYENGPGNYWQNFPTQSPICSGNDGLSGELDGITFSKWREESLKLFGNAIVPQEAFEIFKAIHQMENK